MTKELARVNGMLGNEKFVSRAPQAKIDEEKGKLKKYSEDDGAGERTSGTAPEIKQRMRRGRKRFRSLFY